MSEAHLKLVRSIGCLICVQPAIAHHVRGRSITARLGITGRRRTSDYLAIALCPRHHDADSPDGIHRGIDAWESRYCSQVTLITDQARIMVLDLWKLAEDEAIQKRVERHYSPPVKKPKVVSNRPVQKIRSKPFVKKVKQPTALTSEKIIKRVSK